MKSPDPFALPMLSPDSTMARAYLLMQKYRCDVLPVGLDDQIVGIISMQDIETLARSYSAGLRDGRLEVGNYMQGGVRTVEGGDSLGKTIRIMLSESIQAVIVRQGDRSIGILSREHLLQILAELSDRSPTSLLDTLKATRVEED